LNEIRLEFSNPISQLRHLEKLVFVLKVLARIQSALEINLENRQRDRCESQHRWRVFQRLDIRVKPSDAPVSIHRALHARNGDEQQHGQEEQADS